VPEVDGHFTRGFELVVFGVIAVLLATFMFGFSAWRRYTQTRLVESAIAEAGLNVDAEPAAETGAHEVARPIDRIKALLSS
jgi:hypothetical protein